MSHSKSKQNSFSLRLPESVWEYVNSFKDELQLGSKTTALLMIIREHQIHSRDQVGITHGITHDANPDHLAPATNGEVVLNGITHDAKLEITPVVEKAKKQENEPDGITHGITRDANSSLNAPYIYNNINNNILINNKELSEAWEAWKRYKTSKRKTIKPTQYERIIKQWDVILEAEGVEGIIDRIDKAISAGWTAFYFGKETLQTRAKPKNEQYTTEDW